MIDPQVIQKILSEQLSGIASIMADDKVTEIMVTANGVVWVESAGEIKNTGIKLSESSRALALTAVAKSVGRNLTTNTQYAVVSTSVGGLRFAGALYPLDSRGTTLCIRKHMEPTKRPTLEQLIEWQMLTTEQSDTLCELIIVQKKNAVFVGATGSGKTTLTNAILAKLPAHERLGIIEDAKELAPKNANCDAYLTNAQEGLTSRVLIQHAMRSRYDRLVLGESRGDDMFDVIRAFSSGHPGSITTIHGNSAADGLNTVEMLYQMSIPAGAQIPVEVARRFIASCLQVMVYTERNYRANEDGSLRSVRKVQEIALVKGVNSNGSYETEFI